MYTCEFTENDSSSKSIAIYNALRRWIIGQNELPYSGKFKDWLVSRDEHNAKALRDTIYEEHCEELKNAITKDILLLAVKEATKEYGRNEEDYYDVLSFELRERIFREIAKRIIYKEKLNKVILEMVEQDTQTAINELKYYEQKVNEIRDKIREDLTENDY